MFKKFHRMIINVVILMEIYFIESLNGYFHLYKTLAKEENQINYYYDCFYSLSSTLNISELILQPYCIRPDDYSLKRKRSINRSQILGTQYTFYQLRQLNITVEDLYEWSAPMDIIEHYQLYILNSSIQNGIYYNCSSPFWFGSFCEYTLNSLNSFTVIISKRFKSRVHPFDLNDYADIWNITNGTCYINLKCNRGPFPMCLDWREICDRKCDCLNDCIDEDECFELETNECKEDQYRCSNGMCIAQDLFRDRNHNTDCMDGSDEIETLIRGVECFNEPSFDCDTLTCTWLNLFSCGDGQCARFHPPGSLTGCLNGRGLLQTQVMFKYHIASEFSEECWLAIICTFQLTELIFDIDCTDYPSIQVECPPTFFFPSMMTLFHGVQFVYDRNMTKRFPPEYVCYNASRCDKLLKATVFINGLACKRPNEFPFYNAETAGVFYSFYRQVFEFFKEWCPLPKFILTNDGNCSHPSRFHCKDTSKCISKYHLQDGNIDCYQSYDELYNETCSLNLSHRFYCSFDNRCIPQVKIKDSSNDCSKEEDELNINRDCVLYKQCKEENIIFSRICDGFTEISPILIDNQNETDETNCQYWPCNTHYTHCDKVWNCYNGADELNCSYEIYPYNCNINEHHCLRITNIEQGLNFDTQIIHSCLPMKFAGNKQIDCLGSTDEREYCRLNYPGEVNRRYRCWNDTKCIDIKHLCDCRHDCPLGDDEMICPWLKPIIDVCDAEWFMCRRNEYLNRDSLCTYRQCSNKTDALICDLNERVKLEQKYFSLENYSLEYPDKLMESDDERSSTITKILYEEKNDLLLQWYCNQGVLVYSFDQKRYCFCPPAYYGDRCQYQNEFIGLILNVRRKTPRDYLYIFRIIIVLLDDMKNILFQEQILYVSFCENRYHMYLLYSKRPKLKNENYSIRLDIYPIHRLDNTIQFRTRLFYTIPFTFLPVNRFVIDLIIPEKQAQIKFCDKIQCQNGKCYQYENLNQHYCRCDHGWFGEFCHLHQECSCSPQSICTETGCVCPLGKSGLLCYIPDAISCKEIVCQHGGTCISHDRRFLRKDFECICTEEYEGKFCEKHRMRILIHFNNVQIPSSILIHYLIPRKTRNPDRLTEFKRISLYENIVILYPSIQYNMAFVQFDNNYYLIYLDSIPTRKDVRTDVIPLNRCPYIEELLDHKTFSFHLLKRIKYYQLICQNNYQLRCFYDQTQLCLCTRNHLTNCFDFNHSKTSTCDENDYCQDNGYCYINNLTCPTKFLCVCKPCYHGTLCQFTTSGTILSLDSIIGYHIQPHVSFLKQYFVIKLSTGITILMLLLSIVGNSMSIMTFSRKNSLEVGCGIYLLSSTILSFLTMFIFAYKFWSLLAIQMALITNQMFLYLNCKMIDFLLRFLPAIIEWLNACVATERAFNIILGIHFNKPKSKFWAKFIIIIVIFINIVSVIDDPINRRLLEDTEEQRIWCIVSYAHSSWLNIYNKILNTIHFMIPFSINFISALIIILITARKRSVIFRHQTFDEHLRGQFQQHKHLLISSLILVILALPRLIISFFSDCMKSARDPWLFLSGYFISFIPLVLTFPIFVIPSKVYSSEFISSTKYYRSKIRRYLQSVALFRR